MATSDSADHPIQQADASDHAAATEERADATPRDVAPLPDSVFRDGSGLRPGIEPSTRGLLAALDEGQPLDQLR